MRNILSRILAQLAKAIMENVIFPKAIVIVLDDDMIRALKPTECGATILFDRIIKWLFREIDGMISTRKDQLPKRAVKEGYPKLYWVEAPQHKNFTNNLLRRKLNSVVQSSSAEYKYVRVV